LYETHFRLRELPFGLTPDPSYFFACSSYREALDTLLVAAFNGEGFIKIIGEVGYGKTMLCRTFLAALQDRDDPQAGVTPVSMMLGRERKFVTAYLPNPYLDPRGLLLALAEEFDVGVDRSVDLHMLTKSVTLGLIKIAQEGRHALVCLDEVQAMPQVTIEAVRLLTNLETDKRKLLQVVMFGQPELDQKLQQHSARQMLQRIRSNIHSLAFAKTRSPLTSIIACALRAACKGDCSRMLRSGFCIATVAARHGW
jgi:MSHA biogenesis protein MshM